METPVPVTLLTGFLGAGKTTLLNHLLASEHGARLGVIVNEFDSLGVDRDLVVSAEGQLVEMNNGCLCCSVGGDLKQAIATVLGAGRALDGLLIETTGLANPGPIATAFFADPYLCDATRLDAIVTLVDVVNIERHLVVHAEPGAHEAEGIAALQIAYADVVVLTKLDLVEASMADRVQVRVRALNGTAPVLAADHGQIDVSRLLHLAAFELDERVGTYLGDAGNDHGHDPAVASISVRFAEPLDQVKLNTFFCDLLRAHPDTLYRCKGLANVAQLDEPLVFQGVSQLFATSSGRPWSPEAPRETRAVFIGKGLDRDAIVGGLLACRLEG